MTFPNQKETKYKLNKETPTLCNFKAQVEVQDRLLKKKKERNVNNASKTKTQIGNKNKSLPDCNSKPFLKK